MKKSANKKSTPRKRDAKVNPKNPAIAELGLNPDYYDANGDPIEWTDPDTGAIFGGDPAAFELDGGFQIVGSPDKFLSGAEPQMRPMRLEDLDDDCPICRQNRKKILAGKPPMVLAFD